jgi:glycosyltransferase involved in cell wall biosynthesis
MEDEYFQRTGVKVIHCNNVPRGHNPIQLIRNYRSFAKESKKVVRTLPSDFDVVLGYQLSPISSMLAALEYKKLHGTPVVFYTLDIWPVSAEAMLHGKNNPIFWWLEGLSKRIYKGADRILVTSRPFIDYLHCTLSIPTGRMAYLPQHAGTEMLEMDLQAEDNGVADFMFAGNLGKGQRVDVIIKAAMVLGARKDYKIHIVGDGRMRQELEQMVKENGMEENIVFYGNQKREDMPSFYKKADVLLITLRGNNEVGNTMPGKLQMYMTTGKPVLGAINGAAAEVIKQAQCGSCVKAGDYEGLAQLMEYYIKHPEDHDVCGGNARRYFKAHFTLEKYMEGLETELRCFKVEG